MQMVKTVMISMLNDKFRKSSAGVRLEGGVQAVHNLPGLLWAIRDYDKFDDDNPLDDEHSLGRLDWNGDKIFWKIDYFNETLTDYEDPFSPRCKRVLTVRLADPEY